MEGIGPVNILFASSEITPYAKTGGLGDVSSALPAELRRHGHSVSVVVPFYRDVRKNMPKLVKSPIELAFPLGRSIARGRVWQGTTDKGVTLFAIQRDEFYDRTHLYGNEDGDYADNAARFAFFGKAVVELARHIDPVPEIIHVNDWQTGLIPAFVQSAHLPYKTVLTIHNLAYQGNFPGFDFELTNLPDDYFRPEKIEFYGNLNFLKAGLVLADALTTVSPTYAAEIQTPRFGYGLEGVLGEQAHKLSGILNGIDIEQWNPATDPHLKENYTATKLAGKEACKQQLVKKLGWEEDPAIPLFACVSRLAGQKGFDLLLEVMPRFLATKARLVLLGSGEARLEDAFRSLADKHPDQVSVTIGFDEKFAHRIEAGADFFVMPSEYEPCGLNQFYSMRYGTIPIVHGTGGLADSVDEITEAKGTGTGFVFRDFLPESLQTGLDRAVALYKSKKVLRQIRHNGMKRDFSWDPSVKAYEAVYERVLAGK